MLFTIGIRDDSSSTLSYPRINPPKEKHLDSNAQYPQETNSKSFAPAKIDHTPEKYTDPQSSVPPHLNYIQDKLFTLPNPDPPSSVVDEGEGNMYPYISETDPSCCKIAKRGNTCTTHLIRYPSVSKISICALYFISESKANGWIPKTTRGRCREEIARLGLSARPWQFDEFRTSTQKGLLFPNLTSVYKRTAIIETIAAEENVGEKFESVWFYTHSF